MKSRDGGALGEELRVRDVADVREAARVEPEAHLLARADRHGRLHHEDRPARRARAAPRSRVQTRERSASPECVGGVSTQTNRNSQPASVGRVEREREALAVLLEQRRHVVLVERHLAAARAPRSSRATTSRITTSWPSSAKQAPVTRPTQPAPKMPDARPSRRTLLGRVPSGLRPLAIAIIVSFESESSSVFTTQ